MKRGRSRWFGAAAALGALTLTACSSGIDAATPERIASTESEEPEESRPLPGFRDAPSVVLTEHYAGRPKAALDAQTAYLADHGGLTAYDLDTGEERWRTQPELPGRGAYSPDDIPSDDAERRQFVAGLDHLEAPLLTTVAGDEAVLVGHLIELGDGVGSSLLLADAADGAKLWEIELQSPAWETRAAAPSLYLNLVEEEELAVVTLGNGSYVAGGLEYHRYVVDLARGEVLYELDDEFAWAGTSGGVIYTQTRLASGGYGDLSALDAATGAELWRHSLTDRYATAYGPWLLVTSREDDAQLLRAEDQSVALDVGDGLDGVRNCVYEESLSTLVCAVHEEFVGVNETGEITWLVDAGEGYRTLQLANTYLYTDPHDVPAAIDPLTGETASDGFATTPDAVGPSGALFRESTTVGFHAAE